MRDSGQLIVLSGFTGAGKGTIVKQLLKQYPETYALSVSATTRNPRPGEVEGRDYFFKTKEAFQEMIARGELLEYARYVDHYYGTPARYVQEQLDLGKNVLLEIEIQGGLQIRQQFPDALLLFVIAPTKEILLERLHGRGTESESEITARLQRAVEEAEGCEAYDYLVVNDDLDACVRMTHEIIKSERARMCYCLDEIAAIKEDLQNYVKGEEI